MECTEIPISDTSSGFHVDTVRDALDLRQGSNVSISWKWMIGLGPPWHSMLYIAKGFGNELSVEETAWRKTPIF